MIIMEISAAPCLLKVLQPKACTKAIQTTITSHTHTHTHTRTQTHTHAHTHSYILHHVRITCHQNTHAKRLKIKPLELLLHSLSHSLSLLAHTQVQVTCSFTGEKVDCDEDLCLSLNKKHTEKPVFLDECTIYTRWNTPVSIFFKQENLLYDKSPLNLQVSLICSSN